MSVTKAILTAGDVMLRDATPLDVTARFALGNTPEIHAMFGADPGAVRDITPEAAEAWVQSHIDARRYGFNPISPIRTRGSSKTAVHWSEVCVCTRSTIPTNARKSRLALLILLLLEKASAPRQCV